MNQGFAAALDGRTICAISTPAGMGGIAVVRVSGPEAVAISDRVFAGDLAGLASHRARLGQFNDAEGSQLDECLAIVFRGPRSYTGEDTVEFSLHGSTFIQREAVRALLDAGCRHAGAGEFTQRAFLNRRLDLTQAEAVGDLIAAEHAGAHRLAIDQLRGGFAQEISELRTELIGFAGLLELELDFSEEDVEFADRSRFDALLVELAQRITSLTDSFRAGTALRDGIPVAILGAPNAGKSTLLNALLREDRAIVSATPGTTRDVLEDSTILSGFKFRFIDTAGLRDTTDEIEAEGIRRAHAKAQAARVILYLFDSTTTSPSQAAATLASARATFASAHLLPVWNKIDAAPAPAATKPSPASSPDSSDDSTPTLHLSAAKGTGLDDLIAYLTEWASTDTHTEGLVVTNLRHYEALCAAQSALQAVRTGLSSGLPGDLVASDVRQSLHHLGSITGEIDSEDILDHIFANFCIGK